MSETQVTQAEYHEFIQTFPDRLSYRTGICEPPQEICELPDKRVIGRIILPFQEPRRYYIARDLSARPPIDAMHCTS